MRLDHLLSKDLFFVKASHRVCVGVFWVDHSIAHRLVGVIIPRGGGDGWYIVGCLRQCVLFGAGGVDACLWVLVLLGRVV